MRFLNSLKQRSILVVFGVDAILFAAIYYIFNWFSFYLNKNSYESTQGLTREQLANLLITSPEQATVVFESIKDFLASSIIISVVIAILLFVACAVTRSMIWNYINKKQLKPTKIVSWIKLNLALILISIPYAIVLFVLILIGSIISTILVQIIVLLAALFYLIVLFLTYNEFTKSHKIMRSVQKALVDLKKLKMPALYILGVVVALNLILVTIDMVIFNQIYLKRINAGALLLGLAWLRVYVSDI